MNYKLLLLLLPFTLAAQDIEWEHSLGGRQADYLFDLQPTADYGFVIAGSSLSAKSGNKQADAKGDLDFWIWKMDEHGAEDWQKSFGGSGSDFLMSIRNTRDGGFILGGTSDSGLVQSQSQSQSQKLAVGSGSRQLEQPDGDKKDACRGGNDYWIIKLNAKGVEEWQVTLGGIGQDDLLAVLPTRDGGYIAGGSSASDANGDKTEKSRGNMDYWIVKLDKDGHIQWQRTFGGKYADLLRALEVTSDGGYLLAGYSNSPSENTSNSVTSLRGASRSNPSSASSPSSSVTSLRGASRSKPDKNQDPWGAGGDYWILKLDQDGNIEWQNTLGGDKDEQLFSAVQLQDGNYLVGGSSASGPSGNKSQTNRKGSDIWLLKLDSIGNILWQQTYDIGNADFLASIVENDDATVLLGAYAKAESQSQDDTGDYVAIKIDTKGDELWRKSVGSDGEDILKKAIETRDGGYVLAGTSDPEKSQSQSQSQLSRKGKAGKGGVTVGNDGNLAGADKLQNEMDGAVNDARTQANDFIKDQTDGLGLNKEQDLGGLKLGGQLAPSGALSSRSNPATATGTATSSRPNPATATETETATGIKPGAKQSRDKKANYGNRDFWVVKLKDKDKKIKDKKTIEAFPNPVVEYTNVIVGFDFTKGSLSVYDLGGHQLQTFPITERTIPVNLAAYPEGVYIISVVTDKGEGSLKVMKGI